MKLKVSRGRGPLGSGSNYAGPPAPEEMPGYRQPMMGSVPGEGRFARGSRLSSEAFEVIRRDRGLLGLALCATLLDVVVAGTLLGGADVLAGHGDRRLYFLCAMLVGAYPITVVGTFFNVALLWTVARRWEGQSAKVTDGLQLARSRWRAIVAWSLLAATIGSVFSVAERINHFAWLERLIAYLLGLAWGVGTFFVIPALAADGVGPQEALRRSIRTVRGRWAEGATGTIAIGGATGLLLMPAVVVGAIGYSDVASKPIAGVVMLAMAIAIGLPVVVYSNATSAVFTLAVYRYAQNSSACGPFAEADLLSPFVGGQRGAGRTRAWLGSMKVRRPS